MRNEPTPEEVADWTSGDAERKMRAYQGFRVRTGTWANDCPGMFELYAMGETFASLEPLALLKRIRALEGK